MPQYDTPDRWGDGLTETYKALLNQVYAEYGLTEEQYPLSEELPEEDDDAQWLLLVPFLTVAAVVLLRSRTGRGGGHGGFGGPGVFIGGGLGGGSFGGGRSGGGGFSGGGGGFSGGGASR